MTDAHFYEPPDGYNCGWWEAIAWQSRWEVWPGVMCGYLCAYVKHLTHSAIQWEIKMWDQRVGDRTNAKSAVKGCSVLVNLSIQKVWTSFKANFTNYHVWFQESEETRETTQRWHPGKVWGWTEYLPNCEPLWRRESTMKPTRCTEPSTSGEHKSVKGVLEFSMLICLFRTWSSILWNVICFYLFNVCHF